MFAVKVIGVMIIKWSNVNVTMIKTFFKSKDG
eukprot:UN10542